MFAFPLLVADIGGTSSRFAVLPKPCATLSRLIVMPTSAHATPSLAICAALDQLGGDKPRSAFLGIAGRVDGPSMRMTNASWTVDAERIGRDLGLSAVTLINDYVPVVAMLPLLDAEDPRDLARIGPVLAPAHGNRVALGPGTGLGTAACISVQGRYWLQPTEAGHMDFGACEAEELALWPLIERVNGRISAETVLSGPGLVRLHHAFAQRAGREAPSRMSADVIAAASAGDEAAMGAVRLFLALLGRFAGDMALAFNATGGVFLGSGILPRIVALLDESGFRRAFERKAPFAEALARIPTFVITRKEPAMAGLALIASEPERFAFQAHGWAA